MFGMWYIVFVVAFIAIMSIVGVVLFNKLFDKNYSLYKKYQNIHYFGETKKEREETEAEKEKYENKSSNCETLFNVSVGVLIVCSIALIFLIALSIAFPISASKEVYEFQYSKEYIEFTLENVQDNQSYLTITGDIFAYNNWLAKAKSSVATYGRFSSYYGLVEDLDPVKLPEKVTD